MATDDCNNPSVNAGHRRHTVVYHVASQVFDLNARLDYMYQTMQKAATYGVHDQY